jgi:regulator of cell morphogenesis and NO signaling
MIEITESTTVGEVARSHPASIPLLEKHGIDFCCGGNRPIGEAIREKGIAFSEFLHTVEKGQHSLAHSQSPDWAEAKLGHLIDHIVSRHHTYLRSELPHLAQMMAKVTEAHGVRHGDSLLPLAKLYGVFRGELEDHMWKEENMLFPIIWRLGEEHLSTREIPRRVSVSDLIRVMEFEHRSAGNAIEEMRRLTNAYETPADGCTTYRALMEGLKALESDLHQHIHLENNILFPRAIELES